MLDWFFYKEAYQPKAERIAAINKRKRRIFKKGQFPCNRQAVRFDAVLVPHDNSARRGCA